MEHLKAASQGAVVMVVVDWHDVGGIGDAGGGIGGVLVVVFLYRHSFCTHIHIHTYTYTHTHTHSHSHTLTHSTSCISCIGIAV